MVAVAATAISAADFMTEGRWINALTPRGKACFKWLWTGLPRIPSQTLKSTVYLYHSVEDAEAGTDTGGTAFVVGVRIGEGEHWHLYAVTNWHVACKKGCSVIRVNLMGGGTEVIDLGPEDWLFDPRGHDIAIARFPLKEGQHDVFFLPNDIFANDEVLARRNIGPGEDVFMVGRFIDAGGVQTNEPAVRFGNISMMPVPIKQENGVTAPSYAVDMHSRSGFSGSPVFVFRKPGQDLSHGDIDLNDQFVFLLGIHWGQFPEIWQIHDGPGVAPDHAGEISLKADAKYVSGLSGMTCVAPAQAINDLLDHPKFRAGRESASRQLAARRQVIQANVPTPEGPPSFSASYQRPLAAFSGPLGGRGKDAWQDP